MSRPTSKHLKQRKDGRYCAYYNGKQFMAWSEKEAQALRQAYINTEQYEEFIDNSTTVFAYATKWLPIHRASVAKNTYNSYVNYINVLTTHIGDKELSEVTPSDIKAVYNVFLDRSESTIRKARMLYVDLWDTAIEDGLCRTNPCRSKSAAPHKGTSGTHRALTEEEDALLLWAPADQRLAFLTMRYAGIRRGEAMAMDIDRDIDFDRKIITVRESVRFEGNQGMIVDPKTEAGNREIPLLDILANELEGHHGLLMPAESGRIMTSTAWKRAWEHYRHQMEYFLNNNTHKGWYHRTKAWKKTHPKEFAEYQRLMNWDPIKAEQYRLKGWKKFTVRPHDLRHSFCAMCRDNDIDIKLVIKWMGHADEKMILRIYDHENPRREKSAVEKLNANVSF